MVQMINVILSCTCILMGLPTIKLSIKLKYGPKTIHCSLRLATKFNYPNFQKCEFSITHETHFNFKIWGAKSTFVVYPTLLILWLVSGICQWRMSSTPLGLIKPYYSLLMSFSNILHFKIYGIFHYLHILGVNALISIAIIVLILT